jgi:hypothetical protein
MARQVMQTLAGPEIPLARSEIPVSKVTPLASGHIIRADTLRVELHQPPDTPTVVLLRWPQHPSVTDADLRGLASIAASVVPVLAEAQTKLAQIRGQQL